MIVEFFGPPGAGKSTVANDLAEVLRARGVRVRVSVVTGYFGLDGRPLRAPVMRRDRWWSLASQPRLARLAFSLRGEAASWAVNLSRRNRAARIERAVREHDVIVFEEGPLSAACLLAAATPTVDVTRLRLQLPDVVIRLSVSADVAYKRVRERGTILSEMSAARVAGLVTSYEVAAGKLAAALPIPILAYENTRRDWLAEAIADDLHPIL